MSAYDCNHDDYAGPYFLSRECTADLMSSAQQKFFNPQAMRDFNDALSEGYFVNSQFKCRGWKNISNHYLAWCMKWQIPYITFHPRGKLATLSFVLRIADRTLTQWAYEEADELVFDHVVKFNAKPVSTPICIQIGKISVDDIEEVGFQLVDLAAYRSYKIQWPKVA
ncbi:hypothetical protein [Desulfomonile tiedjei]|uniref:Uncharacterized protein n=1 Tax=Desulfomonile tiedjei (strain ATCC 49306 / DSM 6799 / DCB-1) TaxID=706587 RepID=I4C8Y5_DESTA|nr:hypothetical protein [Desulfomonile tiedjei]AFM26026.1 hypothetical protein Desti_3371 [Desulfomonile tiedjei DSM 6799]